MTGTGLDLTAAACWDEAVQRHGPRRFLRAPRHYLSYAGFDRWARAVAARLAGLSRLGAVAVPLDPGRPEAERQDLVRRSGATLIIAEPERGVTALVLGAA